MSKTSTCAPNLGEILSVVLKIKNVSLKYVPNYTDQENKRVNYRFVHIKSFVYF